MGFMEFLPPLWKFVYAAKMSEEERYHENINLKELFFEAKKHLKSRHTNIFDDDKEARAKEDLKFIETELASFSVKNEEGRKLLIDMSDYIKGFYNIDVSSSTEFMNIFQNAACESFFIDTLEHLNVLDNNGSIKRGFQAVANAIFKTEEYEKKIFKSKLKLQDYILYLNDRFNAKIKSTSKLSYGGNHEKTVKEYFKNNYQSKA